MKIVLGGAGFIGYNLSEFLLQSGEEVLVIDNFDETLYSQETKRKRARKLRDLGASVKENHEVSDWPEALQQAQVVFNLAATAGLTPSWSKFDAYVENNLNFLEFLLRQISGIEHPPLLIHASTSSVYGAEALGSPNQDLRPASPYGVTKLAGENLLSAYYEAFGTPYHILRLFSVYGPHQRPDQFFSIVLNRLKNAEEIEVFGDGTNARSNVFVGDVVAAFIRASSFQSAPKVVDIAGSEIISVIEVVDRFAQLMGNAPKIKFTASRKGDQTSTKGNLIETKLSLGWEPKVDFQTGSIALFRHFTQFPELYAPLNPQNY